MSWIGFLFTKIYRENKMMQSAKLTNSTGRYIKKTRRVYVVLSVCLVGLFSVIASSKYVRVSVKLVRV